MGCKTTDPLKSVSLNCEDIPVGGLKEIYIASLPETAMSIFDDPTSPNFGEVEILAFEPDAPSSETGNVYQLEFNKRDSVTSFNEAKTVDASGIATSVPTLTIEFPKMTNAKRNILNKMANGLGRVALFVKTTAGTKHVLGARFGMMLSEIAGITGTGRTEKNTYTATFTGEEYELSYSIPDTVWANVEGRVSVEHATATAIDLGAATGTVLRASDSPVPTP